MAATTYVRLETNSPPSLKRIATACIGIALWREKAITDVIQLKMYSLNDAWPLSCRLKQVWFKLQKIVERRITQLGLPKRLAKAVGYVNRPIGWQIYDWIHEHISDCCPLAESGCHFLANIFWTPWGTVDKNRTAKYLINDPNVNLEKRFELASIYCLDVLPALWSKMPPQSKQILQSLKCCSWKHDLVVFWTKVLDGNQLQLNDFTKSPRLNYPVIWDNSMNPLTYKFFAFNYYIETIKCIWDRLPAPDRLSELAWVTRNFCFLKAEQVVFFMIHMTDDQQRQTLIPSAKFILKHFASDFFLGDLFLTTIEQMWSAIDGSDFIDLLTLFCARHNQANTCEEIHMSRRNHAMGSLQEDGWEYQIPFAQMWCRSPLSLRKHIFVEGWDLMWELLKLGDLYNLRTVLNCGSDEDKRKFIFCDKASYILMELISNGRLCLLNDVLRIALSSEDEVAEFVKILRHQKLKQEVFKFHFKYPLKLKGKEIHTDKEILDYQRDLCNSEDGIQIYAKLLVSNDWAGLDMFKKICFVSQIEFSDFRKRFINQVDDMTLPRCIGTTIALDEHIARASLLPNVELECLLSYFIPTEEEADHFKRLRLAKETGDDGVQAMTQKEPVLFWVTPFLKWLSDS